MPMKGRSPAPAPPLPLGRIGRHVFRDLVAGYAERGHPDVELAQLAATAARAWEVAEQARAQLEAQGLVVVVGRGSFQNPLVKIERESRLCYIASVRLLRQPAKRVKLGRPGQAAVMAEGRWRGRAASSPARIARYLTPPHRPGPV